MTKATVVEAGIGITYQFTLDGAQTLAFEIAAASTMPRADLDEILDRIGGAAERRQAILEMPICKMNLLTNLRMLENQREGRAKAVAEAKARAEVRSINRRNPVQMAQGDENAIAEFDKRIMQIEGSIKTGRMRIPYLEALIERRPPPDLFPDVPPDYETAMAAE